jgi:hypothetical protein
MSSSQSGNRLVYANAKNTLIRNGINPARAVLSQSYLRMEANMSTSQTQYNFDVLVNDNNNPAFVTKQALNLQDSFIVSDIGVFIGMPFTGNTTEARVKLYSYPDITQFATPLFTNLLALYNGSLSLTVNQRVIVPSWDLMRHYKAPITQSGYSPTGTAIGSLQNSDNLSDDAFYAVEPNIVLVGSKKNQLQITLPQALATIPTTPATGRIVLIFRGLLAQNVTSVN